MVSFQKYLGRDISFNGATALMYLEHSIKTQVGLVSEISGNWPLNMPKICVENFFIATGSTYADLPL